MSVMRRKIAEHMVASRRTSAHVHSVFEVEMTKVSALRDKHKDHWIERHNTKLTFMPFIVKACAEALKAFPVVNASLDGENIVYHEEINIGIAVALDWGLIVPVVRNVEEKSLLGIARAIADLAERARMKKLVPDEVHGGTFSITNPGAFGGQFGLPIISQPQVAILGVGTIEKRAVVRDDAIAIRPMCFLSLGYDHRLVDGAVADQFLALVKRTLEEGRFGGLE
jgi:2-oxoglutarate dehydrogenase E2 component (dihydrolipoamide succinyltransferase)